jgi:hypothetical protein
MRDQVIWSSKDDNKVFHVEQFTRCYKGAKAPDPPPPPPPPPAQVTAAEHAKNSRAEERRSKARGFESTILTGGTGAGNDNNPLGQSSLFKRIFGS